MNLTSFRTLGRSGLVVSPFASGNMTFAAGRWGTDEESARAILGAYAEAGGNFVDTSGGCRPHRLRTPGLKCANLASHSPR